MMNPVSIVLLLSLCALHPVSVLSEELTRTRYAMGTLLRVTLISEATGQEVQEQLEQAADMAFNEVDYWDRLISTYKPDSEVSLINASAPQEVKVSSDTLEAVAMAIGWAEKTNGVFDPTIGPFIKLWGFDTTTPHLPEKAEIELVKDLVYYRNVDYSTSTAIVKLRQKGMALDFGGIGKGWALDKALEKIKNTTVLEEVILDFGGQLLFWSRTPKNLPVAIRHPIADGGTLKTFTVTGNGSLSTSAISERYFVATNPKDIQRRQPHRYGHILDPQTGYPAEPCESVTVWAETATAADVLSTAVFVMGPETGISFADSHRIAAYIVFQDTGKGLISIPSQEWKNLLQ